MVGNLPSKEGSVGPIPGAGTKIPHATGQLSLKTTTTEATHPGTHALQPRPNAVTKTQHSQAK